MIWFTCKQCGKAHGRPESSVGSMVFCECGQGTVVPWECTIDAPPVEATPPPLPPTRPVPRLDPVTFDPEPARAAPGRQARPGGQRPDPAFCLNHQNRALQTTCSDCGEGFCGDCLVHLQGNVLCGPCKNFRVRDLQQPPRVSGFAIASLLVALVGGFIGIFFIILAHGSGNVLWGLVALIPHVLALGFGLLSLRDIEGKRNFTGLSMALTGMLTATVGGLLTLVFTFYRPGLGA